MLVPARTGAALDAGGDSERPPRIGEHYELLRKIGEGSFGVIYLGRSDLTPELVAVKFESQKSSPPQLRDEYRAYKLLQNCISNDARERSAADDDELVVGIPRAYFYGSDTHFHFLILDFLGPSLEDVFDACGRKFSVRTTCFLALQMIARVQTIHKHGLIYRDIKPDNFLLGRGGAYESRLAAAAAAVSSATSTVSSTASAGSRMGATRRPTVYVVDFGMAKHYRDPRTLQHIPYREKKSLSGTARYMSINTHLGREQSRRDDMEALGNVLMYFLRGSLPWQGLKARDNREKYERIGQRKQAIRVEDLCAGFPEAFGRYVAYTRRLAFEEEPDYALCKSWFREALEAEDPEGALDWERLPRLPGPSLVGLASAAHPGTPGVSSAARRGSAHAWPAGTPGGSPAIALSADRVPAERPATKRGLLRRLFCS